MYTENLYSLVIRDGDIVYDVGANIGQTVEQLNKLPVNIKKIYTFEPHPTIYKSLLNNISKLNNCNIESHCVALSDQVGTTSFYFGEDDSAQAASTIIEYLANTERLGSKITEIKVDTTTVDEFSKSEYPNFIKIDVEGAELQVIRGMPKCLEIARPTIYFEIGHDNNYKPIEHLNILKNYGYTLFFTDLTRFTSLPLSWDKTISSVNNSKLKNKLIYIDEDLYTEIAPFYGNILAVYDKIILSKILASNPIPIKISLKMLKNQNKLKPLLKKYSPRFLLKIYKLIK